MEDLPQLALIEASCSESPWGIKMLGEALGLEGAFGCLIEAEKTEAEKGKGEEGQEILGFALFLKVWEELQVLTLCVLPGHRRKGVGRMLLREAGSVAKRMKIQKISLEVRQGNGPALRLYAQMGFVRVGLRKAYYRDGEDAILMDWPL